MEPPESPVSHGEGESTLSLWKDRFGKSKLDLPFPDARLRSLLWRHQLLPSRFTISDPVASVELVLAETRAARTKYSSLQTTFLAPLLQSDSAKGAETVAADLASQLAEAQQEDHPLNPSSSHWANLRAAEALRQESLQDVERCMPEEAFFRREDIQRSLGDVIFLWCRENSGKHGVEGYRQGMHELGGMLLSVLHDDAQLCGKLTDDKDAPGKVLKEIMDSQYVEHDTYVIFSRVMEFVRGWYYNPNGNDNSDNSPMLATSREIFYEQLPKVDPELAAHLQQVDVLPQIFLMRWVRLLFGREYKISEVQQMWDVLFSYSGEDGELVKAVEGTCIAMILRIRWELLESDTSGAFTLLLRYPPIPESSTLTPVQFVQDSHMLTGTNPKAAAELIEKYTGKQPALYESARPSTPNHHPGAPFLYPATSILGRARSPFGASSPATLESLISDAAKGVLERGEKWGVNQAVRDVVKNIQQHAVTPPPRYAPPGGRRRQSAGGAKSETHSAIAANVLRRMNALEERNRRLGSMLDDAVADLWRLYEEMNEKKEKKVEDKTEEGEDMVERMAKAVAKVHFVQAFLKDISLPLPDDETGKDVKGENAAEKENAQVGDAKRSQSRTPSVASVSSRTITEVESPVLTPTRKAFERLSSPARQAVVSQKANPVDIPGIKADTTPSLLGASLPNSLPSSMPPPQPPKLPSTKTQSQSSSPARQSQLATSPPDHDEHTKHVTPTKPRRPLAETSFSWMLADSAASDDSGSPAFARATSFAPNERRNQTPPAARGGKSRSKGFLFGDDTASKDGASGTEEKSKRGRKGSRRGTERDSLGRIDVEQISMDDVKSSEDSLFG
jgi:TBC1 domain family protein 5